MAAKTTVHHNGSPNSLVDKAKSAVDPQNNSYLEGEEYLQSPYKGLNPYTKDDASIFFGRESDVQKVVNNLLAWRLTILYGKSGGCARDQWKGCLKLLVVVAAGRVAIARNHSTSGSLGQPVRPTLD